MDLQLKNRRVLIVGGSRGIGLAAARAFAEEGAQIAICGRSAGDLEKVQRELSPVDVLTFTADAAKPEEMSHAFDAIERDWGGVDIVVSTVSAMSMMPGDEAWAASFEADVMSSVRLVRQCLPWLQKSDAASVVLIGSTASSEASPLAIAAFGGEQPYGAVKAALVNYTKTMALQLAHDGVRINMVSPGNVYEPGGAWDGLKAAMPELYENMLAENPMGRMATTEEVANCILFLASPRAQFVTGQNLIVDGGLTRRVNG
ncbi:SDR family NAD(P)-dependent oxidoreductase [Marinicaulis aureus]|uniref:SDR family NAD(P)-dependent oxidoreductase n=1 Tax=Hyphococcus aureus TaxID=2666033 RepID=A0ABW1KX08_9PROT